MKINPKDDWQIGHLQTIANYFGVEYRQPGTSHVTFVCNNGICLTVPTHKPIKPIYIKKFVDLIESIDKEKIND